MMVMIFTLRYHTITNNCKIFAHLERRRSLDYSTWVPIDSIDSDRIPKKILSWFINEQSMTQAIRCVCAKMTLKLLSQRWCKPTPSDIQYLQLDPALDVSVREVEMLGDAEIWVYARTVLPAMLFRGKHKDLFSQLGTRPIGDILYSYPGIKRFDIQVAHLTSSVPGYESMQKYEEDRTGLWARRAKFHFLGCNLSVSEVIFPSIKECKAK